MSFLFQSLLAIGIPLIAAPLLIHLINVRRRRRIDWAAMDFLLASQKRNRKWIFLKQLLLLLLRTLAIAIVVFMLAGPVVRSGWASLFGRGVTHHLILLDDSYSMADSWEETSAMDQGKRAVFRVIEHLRNQGENQIVTLLRFSEAKRLAAGAGPAIDRRPLDAKLYLELESLLGSITPSESNAGPVDALQAAARLPEPTIDETRVGYLVSDFRRPQWQEKSQLRQLVGSMRERVARLLLVQCVYEERPNLAITRLEPQSGIRGAGVETWMEVAIANYGKTAASAVTVAIEQDESRLPVVEIDELPPGEEIVRRFRVTFPTAGAHRVTANLENDAVLTDNARHFAAEIPATFPVLLIEGAAGSDDGRYLRTALDPGGRKAAGWTPQVEPSSYLRGRDDLEQFAAICLLDVPRLDDAEVTALEEYVRAGGGLAIFLGEQSQRQFYNEQLYREGAGLSPAPLAAPSQLLRDSQAVDGDVAVGDHPIYRVFSGQRNSFLSVARINFFYAVDPHWLPPDSGDVRVIARVRNEAPLSIEKQFGAGRVFLQLCKLAPRGGRLGEWSNWAVNPVFPVFANELVGYLSAARRRFASFTVEEPLQLTLPEAPFRPDVVVRAPGAKEGVNILAAAEGGQYIVTAPGESQSGVWEFELTTREGKPENRLAAVNVPVGEGDLSLATEADVGETLRGIEYQYSLASDIADTEEELTGFRLADALLYALAGVLIVEQLFAVSASYHPAASRSAA